MHRVVYVSGWPKVKVIEGNAFIIINVVIIGLAVQGLKNLLLWRLPPNNTILYAT